jgi:2-polyprenyl-3-methyl-5-hydroxy-6-metoxy-1,4-benzoquinol methylase
MHVDVVPDSVPERLALLARAVPVPMAHTHMALLLARAVIEASRAGVFEALEGGPLTAGELASRCGLDGAAASRLLSALATSGYLAYEKTGERFALTMMARRWMLPSSPVSLHDKMLFTFDEGEWIARMGDFLRTGRNVTGGGHRGMPQDAGFWRRYQRAMRSLASTAVSEVARRTYVPRGARAMLDIGGSHGLFSAAICRRHPALTATILDLPEAIEEAAPLMAAERLGDRVVHRAGDALTTDIGEHAYDLVFIANLVHHFDEATNRALMQRIALALRPGGAVVVQEFIRRASPTEGGQMGALLDLYFAMTSESGTWSVAEIAGWQREAGLQPRRPVYFRSIPGTAQQAAVRSTSRR